MDDRTGDELFLDPVEHQAPGRSAMHYSVDHVTEERRSEYSGQRAR